MRFRGPIKTRLSDEKVAALQSGDTQRLIAINRAEFCGHRMLDDDDDKDKDKDQGGDSGDVDKGSDSGGDDGGDDDKGDSGTPTIEDLARQLAETEKRMKAADKRADAAEKQLKHEEDAKKDELTKATERAEELEQKVAELETTVKTLRLSNAFVTANKHVWHDPETALSLAQSGGYLDDVTDEDGEVDKKALGSALDRLAKDKSYLIKPKEKDSDDDDAGSPSGEPAGGRSSNAKDREARRTQLKSRFPALNR
jgi:hypothetical protein